MKLSRIHLAYIPLKGKSLFRLPQRLVATYQEIADFKAETPYFVRLQRMFQCDLITPMRNRVTSIEDIEMLGLWTKALIVNQSKQEIIVVLPGFFFLNQCKK